MCNFNKQDKDTKTFMALFMQKAANNIGGANFLLGIVEALRESKPHPLTTNRCKIESNNAIIKWNKIVFKDKLEVLQEILVVHKSSEKPDFNLLNIENQKKKKRIINVVKALAPIEFIVKPKNSAEGEGFEFTIFETIDFEKEFVKLNPVFIALFFCSLNYTKQALKYEVV